MSDRHSDLTPVQPESLVPGGDTVPQRGDSLPSALPSPEASEGNAGLEAAPGLGGGRDTVPFRGDSTPMPDASDSVPLPGASDSVSLPDAADSVPLPGAADSVPLPDAADSVPLPGASDVTPAVSALDGGATETLGEAVQAVQAVEGGVESAGGPALERDLGKFVDSAGQGWDFKAPADIFQSGPQAGERMPEGQPGAYDGDVFSSQLDGALAKGLNVAVDTSGLSKDSADDARRRADERPDWAGRVLFQ